MQQYSQYFFIVAIIAVFYFLIIRPQRKRQKDQADLMSNLKPGTEILTIGGLYGTIVSMDDDRVRIVVADGSELVFAKNAIARIVKPKADEADADDDTDVDDIAKADDEVDEAVEAVDETDNQSADESESADV